VQHEGAHATERLEAVARSLPEGDLSVAALYMDLATELMDDPEAAEAPLRQALAIAQAGDDMADERGQLRAYAALHLAIARFAARNSAEAVVLTGQVRDLAARMPGANRVVHEAVSRVVLEEISAGAKTATSAAIDAAFAHVRSVGPKAEAFLLDGLEYLAEAFAIRTEWPRAVALTKRTLANWRALYGPADQTSLALSSELADLYEQARQWDQAIVVYEDLLKQRSALPHWMRTDVRRNLLPLYIEAGRAGDAQRLLLQDLDEFEEDDLSDPALAEVRIDIARHMLDSGRLPRRSPYWTQCSQGCPRRRRTRFDSRSWRF
jgi:hypothetical protein